MPRGNFYKIVKEFRSKYPKLPMTNRAFEVLAAAKLEKKITAHDLRKLYFKFLHKDNVSKYQSRKVLSPRIYNPDKV